MRYFKQDDIRKNSGNVYRLKNQIAMRAKDGEFNDYNETSGLCFLHDRLYKLYTSSGNLSPL